MKKTKVLSMLLAVIMVAAVFAGCGQTTQTAPDASKTDTNKPAESNTAKKLEGTVAVVGSTSVAPLAQSLAEAFEAKEPGVKIDIQSVGSAAGIKAATDGTGDIGMSSRDLKEEEKAGITEHVIALDGIAVAVHPKNPVANLTVEQITKIFKGEIKNWKEVGGADKAILVVSREEGSGTRTAFEELAKVIEKVDNKDVSKLTKDAAVLEGNGAVKASIASKEDAIGYVSLGYLDTTVKGLKVNDIEPTIENVKSKKFPISRPFLLLTKGEIKPATKAYIDYILSADGQKIVSEHYITVK